MKQFAAQDPSIFVGVEKKFLPEALKDPHLNSTNKRSRDVIPRVFFRGGGYWGQLGTL